MVKNGDIHKRSLIDTHERLVQSVDKLLETLTDVVIFILDDIPLFTVLFPEVVSPNQHIGNTHSTGRAIAHVADVLNHIVHKGSEVFRCLIVGVLKEEQTLSRQTGQIIGVAIRQICRGRCIMQIETTVVFGFKPFFCGTQVIAFLHFIEDLVERKQLVQRLALFIQQATDILNDRDG